MWNQRKAKDYFGTESVGKESRDCISRRTIKEFLNRLALAEGWLLGQLLGENNAVRAAATNVRLFAKKENDKPECFFGDLYVVQNLRNKAISFKLYCPKNNKFMWSVDTTPNLNGYVDLKCNTHILHVGNSIFTIKFPDKKERTLFSDNLNKFLFFEKTKR